MFNEYSKIIGLVDNIIKQNDFLEKPLRYSATSTNAMNSRVFIIKIVATISGEDASISLNGLTASTCYRALLAYADELKKSNMYGAKIVIKHIIVNIDGLAILSADRATEE